MGSELLPIHRLLPLIYLYFYAILSEVIACVAGGSGYIFMDDVLTTWLQSKLHTFQHTLTPLPPYLLIDARGLRFDNGRVSRCGG